MPRFAPKVWWRIAPVVELVDTRDSKSRAARRVRSSRTGGTTHIVETPVLRELTTKKPRQIDGAFYWGREVRRASSVLFCDHASSNYHQDCF